MGLKYVLNSMKRRKLRTAIIAMALIVGVALVGALLALIDTQRQFSIQSLGAATGGYDFSISKNDLAASPFFDVAKVEALASATEGEAVTAIGVDTSADTLVSVQVTVNFGSLLLMVIGISLMFYFLTSPLERMLVRLYQIINPRAAFFASRYALRGKGRNALISLMVVQSRSASASFAGSFQIFRRATRADTTLTANDLEAVMGQPSIGTVVRLADNLPNMTVGDPIALRTGSASLVGVADDLNQVLYTNLMRWSEGNATALTRLLTETNAAVISQGLSRALDLHVGDTLMVNSNGTDHQTALTIIGIAARLPGFNHYFRSTSSSNGSGILMNIGTYNELQHDPASGQIDLDADVFTKMLTSAGIAGIVAGTILGYAIEGSSYLQRDQPFLLAFDFNTAGIILVLVCFAAVFSAALATQPVISQKAIKILREK